MFWIAFYHLNSLLLAFITGFCSGIPCSSISHFVGPGCGDSQNRLQIVLHVFICLYIYMCLYVCACKCGYMLYMYVCAYLPTFENWNVGQRIVWGPFAAGVWGHYEPPKRPRQSPGGNSREQSPQKLDESTSFGLKSYLFFSSFFFSFHAWNKVFINRHLQASITSRNILFFVFSLLHYF